MFLLSKVCAVAALPGVEGRAPSTGSSLRGAMTLGCPPPKALCEKLDRG